jgi:hypothetical protein
MVWTGGAVVVFDFWVHCRRMKFLNKRLVVVVVVVVDNKPIGSHRVADQFYGY